MPKFKENLISLPASKIYKKTKFTAVHFECEPTIRIQREIYSQLTTKAPERCD